MTSTDPQREQTEPEEEEEAPDIPVTDQPGRLRLQFRQPCLNHWWRKIFEEGEDNAENTDGDKLIRPEEEPKLF